MGSIGPVWAASRNTGDLGNFGRAEDGPKMAKSCPLHISRTKARSLEQMLFCRLNPVFWRWSAVLWKLSEPSPLQNRDLDSEKSGENIWNFGSRKYLNPEWVPQCSIRGRNRVFGPRLPLWHRFRDQRDPWSGFSHDRFGKFSTFLVKSGVK